MRAAVQHRQQLTAFVLADIDQVSYVHRCLRIRGGQDESFIQAMSSSESCFTDKQGQYLAFIDAYTRVNGRPPAEADMQRHFLVIPPSVHQMVLTLARPGLSPRQPAQARRTQHLVYPQPPPVLPPPQQLTTPHMTT